MRDAGNDYSIVTDAQTVLLKTGKKQPDDVFFSALKSQKVYYDFNDTHILLRYCPLDKNGTAISKPLIYVVFDKRTHNIIDNLKEEEFAKRQDVIAFHNIAWKPASLTSNEIRWIWLKLIWELIFILIIYWIMPILVFSYAVFRIIKHFRSHGAVSISPPK